VDFKTLVLGTLGIIPMALGIVEAAKRFGVNGNKSFALALFIAGAFAGLAEAIAQGLIPAAAMPWVSVGFAVIGGGLAATGLYDLAKKFRPPA